MKKLLLIIAGCLCGFGLCFVPLLAGASDNKVLRADQFGTITNITNGGAITNINEFLDAAIWSSNLTAYTIQVHGRKHDLDLDKFHTCEDLLVLLKAYLLSRGPVEVDENTEEYRMLKACK